MTTTKLQSKTTYSWILIVITSCLLVSFGILTYLISAKLSLKFAIPSFIFSLILFYMCFTWLKRTTYFKYKNNALIIKGAFNKTLLAPLYAVHIDPVLKFSKITLVRMSFALDGIQHSYFSITNQNGLKMLKKRQAISRVL